METGLVGPHRLSQCPLARALLELGISEDVLIDALRTPMSQSRRTVPQENLFRLEGDYWTITFDGKTILLRDTKGLHYLARLLRHPGVEVHAAELVGFARGEQRWISDRLRERFDDLCDSLAEAERWNDFDRAAKTRGEIESLGRTAAAGLAAPAGGGTRCGATERARLMVTQRIKAVIKKIGESSQALRDHLARSVHTGRACVYDPDPSQRIGWRVGS